MLRGPVVAATFAGLFDDPNERIFHGMRGLIGRAGLSAYFFGVPIASIVPASWIMIRSQYSGFFHEVRGDHDGRAVIG